MHLLLAAIPYFLLSGYVAWQTGGVFNLKKYGRLAWILLILLWSFGLPAGVSAGDARLALFLRNAGILWALTLPYWAVATLFFDAARRVSERFGFMPAYVKNNYAAVKRVAFAGTLLVVAGIFVAGYFRFKNPVVTRLDIAIEKRAGDRRELHAVVASDFHLGDFIGRERLADYVRRINALNGDIILLPGDIVDRSLAPLLADGVADELKKLRAPLGVYAILGNHEGFAGDAASVRFLESAGIRVLRDESLEIDGAFYLIGRVDRRPRQTPFELTGKLDRAKPVILMNHRPDEFEIAEAAGVDLQLSGHTHDGQIWPINWLNHLLWDVAYGYARKGNLQVFVTSGLGLWGLPVRIGTDSEIVDLRIRFSGENGKYSVFK